MFIQFPNTHGLRQNSTLPILPNLLIPNGLGTAAPWVPLKLWGLFWEGTSAEVRLG